RRLTARRQGPTAWERRMLSSQAATASWAAPAPAKANAHAYVFVSVPPNPSVSTQRQANTIALVMRRRAKPRRWRYSQGAMMRCRPDRGGDSHHPRSPFGARLSFGPCIGILRVRRGVETLEYLSR